MTDFCLTFNWLLYMTSLTFSWPFLTYFLTLSWLSPDFDLTSIWLLFDFYLTKTWPQQSKNTTKSWEKSSDYTLTVHWLLLDFLFYWASSIISAAAAIVLFISTCSTVTFLSAILLCLCTRHMHFTTTHAWQLAFLHWKDIFHLRLTLPSIKVLVLWFTGLV